MSQPYFSFFFFFTKPQCFCVIPFSNMGSGDNVLLTFFVTMFQLVPYAPKAAALIY